MCDIINNLTNQLAVFSRAVKHSCFFFVFCCIGCIVRILRSHVEKYFSILEEKFRISARLGNDPLFINIVTARQVKNTRNYQLGVIE